LAEWLSRKDIKTGIALISVFIFTIETVVMFSYFNRFCNYAGLADMDAAYCCFEVNVVFSSCGVSNYY
jgi:hypothetical protein